MNRPLYKTYACVDPHLTPLHCPKTPKNIRSILASQSVYKIHNIGVQKVRRKASLESIVKFCVAASQNPRTQWPQMPAVIRLSELNLYILFFCVEPKTAFIYARNTPHSAYIFIQINPLWTESARRQSSV